MISATRMPTYTYTRPPQASPVAAGGGAEVTTEGKMVVTKDVLGFLPVKMSLSFDEVMAGKYGKQFNLDYRDPYYTRLTGNANYGILPVSLNEVLPNSPGSLQELGFRINDDKTVNFDGKMKVFGIEFSFRAHSTATKLSPSTYRFDCQAVEVAGFDLARLPTFMGNFITKIAAKNMSTTSGIQASDLHHIDVDFTKVLPHRA